MDFDNKEALTLQSLWLKHTGVNQDFAPLQPPIRPPMNYDKEVEDAFYRYFSDEHYLIPS
jgi:hypothetical protein